MGQKIYIVMQDDRHADPTATPFKNLQEAREFANQQAIDSARFPEDIKYEPIEGWLYHIIYSCENDSIWIVEEELR